MTIEAVVKRGRLYTCDSTDAKPTGWTPGLLMLEIDTGVWWYTNASSEWKPCYPTVIQHQALMERAAVLELDVEAKAVAIAAMETRITAMQVDVDTLKRGR